MRNALRLTRPYPFHAAADDDDDERDYPSFCRLGCNYFFVPESSDGPEDEPPSRSDGSKSTLNLCLERCEDEFEYTSTAPPYNDLVAIARLECRDGCLLALERCQPGYYCKQVSFRDGDGTYSGGTYSGGEMTPCPPGTYRDVDYGAVEACVPCPPNHFREDVKGRSASSCTPCPAGTSAVGPGSESVADCVRCPAGTFASQPASYCSCITPDACAREQLPSPADAEKKVRVAQWVDSICLFPSFFFTASTCSAQDTVPYIGR